MGDGVGDGSSNTRVTAEWVRGKVGEAVRGGGLGVGACFADWRELCKAVQIPYFAQNTNRKRMYEQELAAQVGYSIIWRKITIESIHTVPEVKAHRNAKWKGQLEPHLFDFLAQRLDQSAAVTMLTLTNEQLYLGLGLLSKPLKQTDRIHAKYPEYAGLINLDIQREELHVLNLIRKRYRQVVHGLFDFLDEEELLMYSRTYRVRYASGASSILSQEDAALMMTCKAKVLCNCNATSEKVFFINDSYLEYLSRVLSLFNAGRADKAISVQRVHRIGYSEAMLQRAKKYFAQCPNPAKLRQTAADSLAKSLQVVNDGLWQGLASQEELQQVLDSGDIPIAINKKLENFHLAVMLDKVVP